MDIKKSSRSILKSFLDLIKSLYPNPDNTPNKVHRVTEQITHLYLKRDLHLSVDLLQNLEHLLEHPNDSIIFTAAIEGAYKTFFPQKESDIDRLTSLVEVQIKLLGSMSDRIKALEEALLKLTPPEEKEVDDFKAVGGEGAIDWKKFNWTDAVGNALPTKYKFAFLRHGKLYVSTDHPDWVGKVEHQFNWIAEPGTESCVGYALIATEPPVENSVITR